MVVNKEIGGHGDWSVYDHEDGEEYRPWAAKFP